MNPGLPLRRKGVMEQPGPSVDTPAGDDVPVGAPAIRRRLMDRVADTDTSHLTIAGDEGEWRPLLAGVAIKVLREQAGVLSYLLRLDPGATLPPHRHPQDEECIVLQGRVRVGAQIEIGPGGYHLAHRGALHATIGTETGAILFLRGAVPHASQVLE